MNATAKRVILIDDQKLYRECLKEVLNRNGLYNVVAESGKGEGGINTVMSVEADIILLDLMPSVSGYGALKEVRDAAQGKIMILSTEDKPDSIRKIFDMGVDGFCAKDVSLEDLIDALDKALEGKHPIHIDIKPNTKPAVCEL